MLYTVQLHYYIHYIFLVARPGNVVRRATTPEEDPETILAKKMMVILHLKITTTKN